jgi:hypothetical protein
MPAVDSFQPGEFQIHRRAFVPARGIQRRVLAALAVVFVGDADLELVHPVEDVELGDAQAGDTVDRHRALERDDVHPAAAPRTTRGGAEFLAALADAFANVVVQFGRERSAADARGVGLGDAEHVVDRIRADAGTGKRAAHRGVAGGDVGIGAVIDVEQGALRAFEQHLLALLAQLVQDTRDVALHRLDVVAERDRFVEGLLEIDTFHAQVFGQHEVVVIERGAQLLAQFLRVLEVGDTDATTRDLVFVGRADAAPGGPDGLAASGLLARLIERDVVRHDQGRGGRDP